MAAVPPAAEEGVLSNTEHSSDIQDDAKTKALEPMVDKQPAATPSHKKTGNGTTSSLLITPEVLLTSSGLLLALPVQIQDIQFLMLSLPAYNFNILSLLNSETVV